MSGQRPAHLVGLGAERRRGRRRRCARRSASRGARQHLVDALAQVGLHVVVEPGIGVDDLLDRRERLVVVGVAVDADPVLAEVRRPRSRRRGTPARCATPKLRTPGIVRSSRLACVTMRRSSGCDVPGRGDPVHQEVALLEGREQGLAEPRQRRRAASARATTAAVRRAGAPAQDEREQGRVAALAATARAATRRRSSGALAQQDERQRRRDGQRDDHRGERRPARTRTPAARKNEPVRPCRKNTGTTATTLMSVA